MKDIKDYQGKNVLVVGLGKSGINAAYLLKRLGANVRSTIRKSLKTKISLQLFQKETLSALRVLIPSSFWTIPI